MTLVYNLLRKVIGHKFRLPSVKKSIYEIASTLDGGMLFFFNYQSHYNTDKRDTQLESERIQLKRVEGCTEGSAISF